MRPVYALAVTGPQSLGIGERVRQERTRKNAEVVVIEALARAGELELGECLLGPDAELRLEVAKGLIYDAVRRVHLLVEGELVGQVFVHFERVARCKAGLRAERVVNAAQVALAAEFNPRGLTDWPHKIHLKAQAIVGVRQPRALLRRLAPARAGAREPVLQVNRRSGALEAAKPYFCRELMPRRLYGVAIGQADVAVESVVIGVRHALEHRRCLTIRPDFIVKNAPRSITAAVAARSRGRRPIARRTSVVARTRAP